MLTGYSVTNFRSILYKVGISKEQHPLEGDDVVSGIAAIYGRNSAGKTAFVESVLALKMLVLGSSKYRCKGEMPMEPCILRDGPGMPTVFDVEFIHGKRYRYSVSVLDGEVLDETLIADGGSIFKRAAGMEGIVVGESVPDEDRRKILFAYGITNPFSLLLSKCSESRIGTTREPFEWFRTGLRLLGDMDGATIIEEVLEADCEMFLSVLRHVDAGISDVILRDDIFQNDDPFGTSSAPRRRVLIERIIDGNHHWSRMEDESSGTIQMLLLSAYLVLAIRAGWTLVVDELERSLHPTMVDLLIGIVSDPVKNPNGAQLIFTAHDADIVGRNGLAHNQVWVASRDPSVGITVMHPLAGIGDLHIR